MAIPADRNVTQNEAEKRPKITTVYIYRDTANVELEMYDYTGNNRSHWNSNRRFKEMFVSRSSKTVNVSTTNDSCTWNVTRNTGGTAV